MPTQKKRIAINFGGGYVPGLNSVIAAAARAAAELGWETVGICDGFDSLLFPERYPDGAFLDLASLAPMSLDYANGCILGTAAASDPFHVRAISPENIVEEVDRSDDLLRALSDEGIDAVISVAGSRALSILHKLSRKGLTTVCIPKSIENDIAATSLSFGFNSALSFLAEMLERARHAARSARRIGVVEVPGEFAGWLALQSGMAVCADAVLIPEIPYDLKKVAQKLKGKADRGQGFGLVVVAEGAKPLKAQSGPPKTADASLRVSLSPGATGEEGPHVIERSGRAAAEVSRELTRLTDLPGYPLVLSEIARGGVPTVVDRQLGLGYGAAAVRALKEGHSGVMVIFEPPDINFISLAEAINKVRAVPSDSEFLRIVRALGICLGD